MTPWLDRMTSILGLYEYAGDDDNPAILSMAKQCGGQIAKTYTHDSIAWCALTINYCLVSTGFTGNDSLWALDFRKYGVKLSGPAVGAIATKTREEGGHVFLIVGRTTDGHVVGRGGNQSDMVCDETFDPSVLQYNWPSSYPAPSCGLALLPVVSPAPKIKRPVSLSDIKTNAPKSRYTNIIATVFGGGVDDERSAYTGELIDEKIIGVALPARFAGPRPKVRLFANGKVVLADIVDVGPWNTDDPYWQNGARPQAESGADNKGRKTNRAGIDLTPACARALSIYGKGLVDWEFVAPVVPPPDIKPLPAPQPNWLARLFNALFRKG